MKIRPINIKALAFRFRVWIVVLLYLLGFLAPWERAFTNGPTGTLWLAASALLARTGWMNIATSTLVVTVAALCCCLMGAVLRVSGTAYLSAPVMRDHAMHGDSMVAAGPYRLLRNPLYLGSWLLAAGISVLMPPSGALFFLIALWLFQLALISGEERFLSAKLGGLYDEYRRRVPRFLPRRSAWAPQPGARPRWLEALFIEIFPVGFTLCFFVFAWRYNRMILIKCLIICYGLSLIARALQPAHLSEHEARHDAV